ncbi:Hypothetical protein PHPALM_6545 [Phytophthora palmivora]|uniref:Uncharacterized protein n=1 Tax=Phytophthora palmivora TaxID=4796 RepID=A0A2P4YEW2_9STRA|nr:Hypothetical protein PHPALM_6545 [Phytophthora palmivora]
MVSSKRQRRAYESSSNRLAEFYVANGFRDSQHERHHELPVVLDAYLQSISASSSLSLQITEKARSAIASYFSSHENSDCTDVNPWSVQENDAGEKQGYGNPARDPFVRQFMRGLEKKKAFYGMCRINEVLTLKWKDISLRQFCESILTSGEMIEFGTYALFYAVAESRLYILHKLPNEEAAINAYVRLCCWVDSIRSSHANSRMR